MKPQNNNLAPAEDVGAEHAANDVAQMGDVVDVWQRTGHKHVPLAFLWQTGGRAEGGGGHRRFNLSVSSLTVTCYEVRKLKMLRQRQARRLMTHTGCCLC